MKKQPFLHSFRYAVQGVRTALREERNLRFHVCAAFYVYVFSLFYEFTRAEYCLITIMVGGVMALELVNSSLERAVERPVPERYMTAGAVKDMAAGAVLVFSIASGVRCAFVLGHGCFCAHVALFSALARAGPCAGGHTCGGIPLYFW